MWNSAKGHVGVQVATLDHIKRHNYVKIFIQYHTVDEYMSQGKLSLASGVRDMKKRLGTTAF